MISKMYRHLFCFGLVLCGLMIVSCQKKPSLAPSADPFSSIEPPPMGGTTYNDVLKKEIGILTDLLEQRIDKPILAKVKSALMSGNIKALTKDATSYESHLAKVLLTLPELVHPREDITPNRKLWYQAKFLFLQRRFVEAAMRMTEVLQQEPNFVEARNWRARAIFFLGNPDLAIAELNKIIDVFPAKSLETLDALYLTGAIIYESNHRLPIGINAWELYLERAETNPELKKEILDGIAELKRRKEGDNQPATNLDPFMPSNNFTPEKNAILVAFAKDELELALNLTHAFLKKTYDNAIATVKARIYFKQGRLDDAASMFLAIVAKDKSYAPGYHYQGMVFMLKGEPQQAINSWQKTAQLDPTYAKSHGLLQRIAVAEKMVGEKSN